MRVGLQLSGTLIGESFFRISQHPVSQPPIAA